MCYDTVHAPRSHSPCAVLAQELVDELYTFNKRYFDTHGLSAAAKKRDEVGENAPLYHYEPPLLTGGELLVCVCSNNRWSVTIEEHFNTQLCILNN